MCESCKGIGKVPSAEEYAIHDHEGFDGIYIGQFTSIKTVALHARMLGKHDGAWPAYVGHVGIDSATEDNFTNTYHGKYDSAEDFAEEFAMDTTNLKNMGKLANYIDWERYARDMKYNGWSFVDGGIRCVYVFSPG